MKYLVEIRIVTMLIVFGFYACDDPERTNPNDPNYEISPPTNLVAQAISDESIHLTWQDNESHELGFKIERDAGSGFVEIGMVGPNVTEYTDTGLTYGQSYGYRVAAYTSVNTSNWAIITAATEFPAPTNLSASSLTDSELRLTWTDNTGYEDGFKIERDEGSGFVQLAGVDANVTEYTDTGLTYGQSYGYRVAAYTSINTSDYSGSAITTACLSCMVDYDGNIYETIQIGDQVWMAENLRVTHYRDGTAIPNLTSDGDWTSTSTGAYCYYANNSVNGETYGALYNWYAVTDGRDIAPEGWHVPTDADWKELEMFLGMSQSEADATGYRGTNEGSKLAGNAGLWTDGSLENNSGFGTSGFTALPGGYRYNGNGYFYYMG
ncbi:MAG: fibronectin type III domain-containing protein, partial [FCB group bacterium]|nr:fibronectin type III domain-containing protein [FCB group bacterium]